MLLELVDRILNKGIVIDLWARVSVLSIEALTVEARAVVASVETYQKYADDMAATALAAAPPQTRVVEAPAAQPQVAPQPQPQAVPQAQLQPQPPQPQADTAVPQTPQTGQVPPQAAPRESQPATQSQAVPQQPKPEPQAQPVPPPQEVQGQPASQQ